MRRKRKNIREKDSKNIRETDSTYMRSHAH